jgi:hypothetical protein
LRIFIVESVFADRGRGLVYEDASPMRARLAGPFMVERAVCEQGRRVRRILRHVNKAYQTQALTSNPARRDEYAVLHAPSPTSALNSPGSVTLRIWREVGHAAAVKDG